MKDVILAIFFSLVIVSVSVMKDEPLILTKTKANNQTYKFVLR